MNENTLSLFAQKLSSGPLDPSIFERMSSAQLQAIDKHFRNLRKQRMQKYIKPQIDQHLKPLRKEHIEPLKNLYIKPIDDALKLIRKHIPEQPKYWQIGESKFGPMTKKQLLAAIRECRQ